MKKIICLIFVFTFTFSFIFAFGGKDKAPSGNITIYTSMYEHVIESIKNDLQKQFPKCKIEFVYGGTVRQQTKIASEKAAGQLGCDIIIVADPTYSLELKEKGILHSYKSKEAANLAFDYDPSGYWYPVRVSNMVLAFNPERHSSSNLPASFRNLASDARVRGAIAMSNPRISGTSASTITALKDLYGYSYFDSLSEQGISFYYGSDEAVTKLENGEFRMVMILEETILRRRQQGSKLEVIYPSDGTVMIPSPIMIVNNKWSANKNVKAAEAITDWFLSEQGQNAIVNGWMHSVRTDFSKLPYDAKPTNDIRANSISINWESHYREMDEIRDRFEDSIARRRR